MTVDDLRAMANDKICFGESGDVLLVRSQVYGYADFFRYDAIASIERTSTDTVRISVPDGTMMGDHELVLDFSTGLVTADGKVFDEPVKTGNRRASSKETKKVERFTPSINGFSISSLKMMPSSDGYAVYCSVCFNGKKVGDFSDSGDGGMYMFTAKHPYSADRIADAVRSFPSAERDYGYGIMGVPYDIGQMVDELIGMKEIAKELKKAQAKGRDYVLVDEWKTGRRLAATPLSSMSDEELAEGLKSDLSSKGITEYEIRRYRSLDDLKIVNRMVSEEMLI